MLGCVDVDLSGDTHGEMPSIQRGSKGLEASEESRGGVLRFENHGSLLKWQVRTEEAERTVVKRGGRSYRWFPGDFCPEHACKLSKMDWERRGGGGEYNKGGQSPWYVNTPRDKTPPLCLY